MTALAREQRPPRPMPSPSKGAAVGVFAVTRHCGGGRRHRMACPRWENGVDDLYRIENARIGG